MQIIPQVISAIGASMSIKNSKVGDLLPFSAVFGLWDIQNNSHSILIVISDGALICGRGICFDMSIRLDTVFGRLKIRDWQQHFRQGWVGVLDHSYIPHPQILILGIQVNFLPHNFIRLPNRRLGLGPRLVLISISLLPYILNLSLISVLQHVYSMTMYNIFLCHCCL